MVVFTCNHCGDSLQKPKVAKHYQTTCKRNPISLTCVDCFKDFNLQEYVTHIKCLTEDQRYSAKGTIIKSQKGEAKQTEWVETVNSIIEQQQNAKPGIKGILEAISDYTNIPRKKAKFINFMTNAFGNRFYKRDIEEVWDLLEKHKEAQRKPEENEAKPDQSNGETKSKKNVESEETVENGASGKTAENGTSEEPSENGTSEKKTKKKRKNKQANGTTEPEEIPEKKQKLEETNEDTSSSKKKKKKSKQPQTEETPETNGAVSTPEKTKKKKTSESNDETNNSKLDESQNEKFSFKQVITDILTKKSKGLTKEALQNKVLKKYEAEMGPIENKETLLKKYNKKLRALKNVTCENDKYKIVSE